ncbi:MAG: hypothetical protein Devi2KO_40520 [Devosia indica]
MDDAEEDWDVATGIQDEAVASLHLDASGLSVAKVGNELKESSPRSFLGFNEVATGFAGGGSWRSAFEHVG